nr:sortase [Clostridia bacterium]
PTVPEIPRGTSPVFFPIDSIEEQNRLINDRKAVAASAPLTRRSEERAAVGKTDFHAEAPVTRGAEEKRSGEPAEAAVKSPDVPYVPPVISVPDAPGADEDDDPLLSGEFDDAAPEAPFDAASDSDAFEAVLHTDAMDRKEEYNVFDEFDVSGDFDEVAEASAPEEPIAPSGQPAAAQEQPPVREGKKKKKKGFFSRIRKNIPSKGDSAGEVIRKLILDISALAMVGALLYIGYFFVDYGLRKWQDIRMGDLIDENPSPWDEIRAKYPDVDFPEGMQAKWAALYARNSGFVGWLSISNTNIWTAILQANVEAGDDKDLYLRHDIFKNYSRYGNPYLDYRNVLTPDEMSRNMIIYGHNMQQNVMMFSELEKYKTIDGFIESPTMNFDTLYSMTHWKVCSAFITNAEAEEDNGYLFHYMQTKFVSEDEFLEFADEIKQRSMYDTGVDIKEGDILLTLSTCTYEFDEGRLVIVARMVRPDESEDVDVSLAKENPNARYPQAWYDKKGIENPWIDAEQWYPEEYEAY